MVILAVLSGAELGGVVGVFLSVPVAALLIVCLRHWRDLRHDRSLAPDNEPSRTTEPIARSMGSRGVGGAEEWQQLAC